MTKREIEILAAAGTPPNMDPETWSHLFNAMTTAGQDAGKGKGKDTGKGACKGTGVDAEGGGGGKGKVGGGGGKCKGDAGDAGGKGEGNYCAHVYLMSAGTPRIITADILAAQYPPDTYNDVGADNANN